ncbi:putative 2-aminoethylphosphonate ABC transporter ATP-binding protein [Gloeocapsa sp. PCC 73106]|uniref:putative 2-aminoethylphosphonate ABC transporter ATP-binding protein n=1 Tax=Gloeocapsa sp. PCC 73106 TaxID=102232 RepID=UPI0002ABD949|nr:putative 2-aminoethylphosphonate ABC transporter ATP-binding protein [Gloeocapsa sp. PCC 73106]ELR98107.1 putative 2-aminoethylphosphonate ABC transporter, ATP-binding protein [Gloeocapsa sp. PCC 73106]
MTNYSDPTKIAKSQTSGVSPQSHSTPPDRATTTPYLQVEGVTKDFGKFVALKDIYLDVYPGEFVCLLGPSGCGKTTLLRIIAGLEQQTTGRITQGGKDVSRLSASQRDFGIVFQSYALFPNLTAAQNIAYGLQNTKEDKQKIKNRVEELLNLVGLNEFRDKYPAQMSGGQQQRVALARALALSPGLLLLDEPLSALDAQVRVKLRSEITQVHRTLGITTIMVTHDQSEALAMADRAVVMDKGYIAQVGSPHAIYKRPNTPFVANFIGVMNFLKGVTTSSNQVRCGNIVLQIPDQGLTPSTPVRIAIRPEDVVLVREESNLTNIITATVESVEFLGSAYHVALSPQGDSKEKLTIELSSHQVGDLDLTPESTVQIQLPPEHIQVFPES